MVRWFHFDAYRIYHWCHELSIRGIKLFDIVFIFILSGVLLYLIGIGFSKIFLKTAYIKTPMRKTIVHVYLDKTFGYGDYVRGSIYLAQFCIENGFDYEFDLSQHPIGFFMVGTMDRQPSRIENAKVLRVFHDEMSPEVWKEKFDDFKASDETTLYVLTNFFYDAAKITKEIKGVINSKFQIRPEYYRKVDELRLPPNYNVLHVRCSDENVIDIERIVQKTKALHLPQNTVVLSSDFNTKKKITRNFRFLHVRDGAGAHGLLDQCGRTRICSDRLHYSVKVNKHVLFQLLRTRQRVQRTVLYVVRCALYRVLTGDGRRAEERTETKRSIVSSGSRAKRSIIPQRFDPNSVACSPFQHALDSEIDFISLGRTFATPPTQPSFRNRTPARLQFRTTG